MSYVKLCDALDISILPAECSDGVRWSAAEFIRRGASDSMRTEAPSKGGFTGGLKVAHLAESFGIRVEVHGADNAKMHLGLAIPDNIEYEDIIIDAGTCAASGTTAPSDSPTAP